MADAENSLPPSKKRAAGRELSRENPGLDDEEDAPEQETGTFKRASDEVLAARRIVKVRRQQTTSAPTSNPFAGIRLVPPTESSAIPAEDTTEAQAVSEKTFSEGVGETDDGRKETEEGKDVNGENDASKETEKGQDGSEDQSESKTDEPLAESAACTENAKDKNSDTISEAAKPEVDDEQSTEGDKNENEGKDGSSENIDSSADATRLNSFQQLSSSQNAFTGLAGTGFSSSTFSFGSISKDGSQSGASSGSLFGLKSDQPSYPSFGFGLSNNGNSSLFGTSGTSIASKTEGSSFPSMHEVPIETGEENEVSVFSADSVLFEFLDGGWKERGKGELKVNVSTTGTGKARLVMRARGNYRLILNASLYPDMKLTNMEKRGITFACVNSTGEGKDGLSTFALKFKDGSIVEDFCAAVAAHNGKTASTLKTPENSPKATDD
ncbi:hypothetical protein L1049_004973 [Liquidambar formosana]|uniref:RanBD1 domain-containing protein n=1 Tax=Liquidambar formosana TaxID=63359 RepID=A0AAP0RUM9_LIQFO